jgi:hypothetical protein
MNRHLIAEGFLPHKLQEIINENRSTTFLLNSYFRIQKNDKESLKKYSNLKNGQEIKFKRLRQIMQVLRIVMKIVSFIGGSLFYFKQVKHFRTNKFKTETLFISHASKTNISGKEELFFGDLPKLFNKKNCSVLYLNHTRGKYSKILSKLTNKQISKNVLLMPKFLHPLETKEYLGTMWRLLKDHLKIANSYGGSESLKANILIESIPWIFSRETYNNFNLIKRTTELQKYNKFKNLFLTLEGYNYEELLATHLFSRDRNLKIFFYQHSPLTKAHTGVQLFVKNFKQKICILTTGPAYSKFLMGLSSRNAVICVGSLKVMSSGRKLKQKNFSILIAPEGTTAKTNEFLDFTLQIARAYPNAFFVFRFHPNLVLKRSTKKLKRCMAKLDNVEISTKTLTMDISRTGATMYAGSVVAIEALNSKNLPIFVNFDDNLEVDVFSIVSFDYPRINATKFEEEFINAIGKISDLNLNTSHAEQLYRNFQIPQNLVDELNV